MFKSLGYVFIELCSILDIGAYYVQSVENSVNFIERKYLEQHFGFVVIAFVHVGNAFLKH